jgi:hypothetical protein
MPSVATLASRCLLTLLVGFLVVTAWKLFTREVSLARLLSANGGNGFSPARAQMLMITLLTAVQYITQVIQDPTVFPQIPTIWLSALGTSHGIYLGGKAAPLLRKLLTQD